MVTQLSSEQAFAIRQARRSDVAEGRAQEIALLRQETGLTIPQIRVLQVLGKAKGPLSRTKINERVGNKTVVVTGRAVGYSDPEKRAAFEQTKDGGYGKYPSLLTLGLVREKELDIDGASETAIELTAKGRKAYETIRGYKMPLLKGIVD